MKSYIRFFQSIASYQQIARICCYFDNPLLTAHSQWCYCSALFLGYFLLVDELHCVSSINPLWHSFCQPLYFIAIGVISSLPVFWVLD